MKLLPEPTHREQVALFRLGVIGDLLALELSRGELREELIARAKKRYRPPGADKSRHYHHKTLQRWYYEARRDLVGGLLPESRARGFALELTDEQRELLLEMRREHPSAAAELLRDEAVRYGALAEGALSLATLRRLYAAFELPRQSKRRAERGDSQRRRWQAAHPGDLWHSDVCHVKLDNGETKRTLLVHGFLDDASRKGLTLVARVHEREQDLLEVFLGLLLKTPPPRTLYVDNGAGYRGELLALVCKRLGIRLIHAVPYSPESRGKMERFWRTMRQRCTDHLSPEASLHDVNQALWAWLDTDYNRRPHAALMGQTPHRCYLKKMPAQRVTLTPKLLAQAVEVGLERQVRRDATFDIDGVVYEVAGRHLAGKRIAITCDGLTGKPLRATWQGQELRFGRCDAVANRQRRRPAPESKKVVTPDTPFDPIAALLAKARETGHE